MFPEELVGEPAWRFFRDICGIPHTSGNEAGISKYLVDFARERGLEVLSDPQGNVLIRKDGPGQPVALQAHMDMVGEKISGSNHDFLVDPIKPELDGDLLLAGETTLGADNGIGVALMLELLHGDYSGLPSLECLFTVDEERGLVGALAFPPEWITAGKLINLDSEELGVITIGCAGGRDVEIELSGELEDYTGSGVKVEVNGLNGGHSGMEINSDNANAIKLTARLCRQLEELLGGRLVSFRGGSKHNAIPRTAEAVMALDEPARAKTLCSIIRKDFLEEYAGIEDTITVKCTETDISTRLTEESSSVFIDTLLALPHGVEKMSGTVDDLVETSANLAIASWERGTLKILISIRSAVESAKNAHLEAIAAIGRLAGGRITAGEGYPGWTPDTSSDLLDAAKESYRRTLGSDPTVEAIHAGLECGIIGQRVGDLEMISLGPDISDVHVPGEAVSVSSVDQFLKFLLALLENL